MYCSSAKDGRVVAYSGDDKADEHLYRFVSSKPNSLDEGELFVADIKKGKWLSLDYEKQAKLQKNFKDQIEVLTFCREAAKILGATPLDRPEDIEIHPKTGDVYVALTNNVERMNFHGSIMKLIPENGDHESENFSASDFLVGGDGVSREELQAKLGKSGKITTTRLGELVKSDMAMKTADDKYKITTFGIVQMQKDIIPKIKVKLGS